jgi:hypothetical protein
VSLRHEAAVAPRVYRSAVPSDPLEELFEAPLDEFVATRNRIAGELRKAGEKDEAERVKAIRKPPAVVWAVNRLARTDPGAVGGLLEAAEDVRAVQSGRSEASFAEAQRRFAAAAWELAQQAAGLLEAAGRKPGDGIVQRLGRALTAAAASPETADLLRAGRLEEEPETVGFGGIGPVVERTQRGSRPQDERAAERDRKQAEKRARERLEQAQRELREAKAEAARLHREAERAQEQVERLERSLARLRADG